MKVIYVAGPFRAGNSWDCEQNIRRAEVLALEVWVLGAAAICPHTNTRFFDGVEPHDMWLKGDIEIMKRCDAVLLVSGWEVSEGTKEERRIAIELRIPVFTSIHSLNCWLKTDNDFFEDVCESCHDRFMVGEGRYVEERGRRGDVVEFHFHCNGCMAEIEQIIEQSGG